MAQNKQISPWEVGRLALLAALSVGVNHLINLWVKNNKSLQQETRHPIRTTPSFSTHLQLPDLKSRRNISMRELPFESLEEIDYQWGQLQLESTEEDLLREIDMMTRITCPFEKVNNLIVDLKLHRVRTYPCPLVAHHHRKHKNQGFLFPQALVPPGCFVIQNCLFRAGQSLEIEKKFLRAGPRSTQYFEATKVVADIVVVGKVAPGINNIIRELVYLLKEVYQVKTVTGIRFGFKGYLENDSSSYFIDLTPSLVETIHHKGGSFLGLSKKPFNAQKIINSLVQRGVNQLYLIGGNDTVRYAIELYRQIRKRKLQIALCVNLKAINKDIAYIDNCFGFESAVEQTQRFVEEGYSLCKSNFNSVILIKVPGRYSGFLAMDTVSSARNVHVCLVPQFPYDLYGNRGLLRYISDKVKLKGYCIIVYSEGAPFAARDIDPDTRDELEYGEQFSFDIFLKKEIIKELKERDLNPHNVFFTDCQNAVRTVPANAFDTKLCSQTALASIQGLMCGYTNFGIGHLRNRIAMIPLDDMAKANKFHLKSSDENWQRLLATTGQPSFINDQEVVRLMQG